MGNDSSKSGANNASFDDFGSPLPPLHGPQRPATSAGKRAPVAVATAPTGSPLATAVVATAPEYEVESASDGEGEPDEETEEEEKKDKEKKAAAATATAAKKKQPVARDDDDEDFLSMLRGPKENSAMPCSICGTLMKIRRWRCWECDRSLCGSCSRNPTNPHRNHLMSRDKVEQLQPARGGTIRDVLRCGFRIFRHRPLFGLQADAINPPSSFPLCTSSIYDWYSYHYVHERAKLLAVGLRQLVPADKWVGICGESGMEWIITDLACLFQGIVSVPVNPLFNSTQCRHVIESTRIHVLLCAPEQTQKFVEAQPGIIQHVIEFDQLPGRSGFKRYVPPADAKVTVHSLTAIEQRGRDAIARAGSRAAGRALVYAKEKNRPETLITIGYTGGTTGAPKGCMIAERSWANRLSSFFLQTVPLVELNYEPLTHFNGRKQIMEMICKGGRCSIFQPSIAPRPSLITSPSAPPRTVAHALRSLSPVVLALLASFPDDHDMARIFLSFAFTGPRQIFCLPMLWNNFYKQYHRVLAECLAAEGNPTDAPRIATVTEEVATAFRSILGPRLKSASTGSAAISPIIYEWMKKLFGKGVLCNDAYGSTETGAITNEYKAVPHVKLRLRDIPEQGYLSTDKPYPRGEILVKTPFLALGYYQRPQDTAAKFLDDGWYATGDVAQLVDGDRYIIIDRATSLFKISCGEFVCPEKLESIYLQSKYVKQVVVLGDASVDTVVAIVVPTSDKITPKLFFPTHDGDTKEVKTGASTPSATTGNGDAQLSATILRDLVALANDAKFQPFEIPSTVHILHEPFSVDNGCLTSMLKINRSGISRAFDFVLASQRATPKTRT